MLLGMVLLGLLTAIAALQVRQPSAADRPTSVTDQSLYAAVAADIGRGQNYYQAAQHEHRAMGFPLRPVVTVRPPLLAKATGLLGRPVMLGLLGLLAAASAALSVRLSLQRGDSRGLSYIFAFVGCLASFILVTPGYELMHEIWAGLLLTCALLLHHFGWRFSAWWVALLAAILRELALPFLFVMAFAAFLERRPREAVAWLAALVAALVMLTMHWLQVAAIVPLPGDATSPGWGAVRGFGPALQILTFSSVFIVLPLPFGHLFTVAALTGWCAAPRPLALRAMLWLGGMTLVFGVFARAGNGYWGGLTAPLLPLGLLWLPGLLARLLRAASPPRLTPA